MVREPNAMERVLRDFVEAVNVTGGVGRNDDGTYSPEADAEWVDLGDIYMEACEVLGVTARVAYVDEEE